MEAFDSPLLKGGIVESLRRGDSQLTGTRARTRTRVEMSWVMGRSISVENRSRRGR